MKDATGQVGYSQLMQDLLYPTNTLVLYFLTSEEPMKFSFLFYLFLLILSFLFNIHIFCVGVKWTIYFLFLTSILIIIPM